MRIRNIHLKNYKRFTELTIADLPATAKLVVLVGPNGTGKSSVFDSFLLKAGAAITNRALDGNNERYYEKVVQSSTTHEVANRVGIEFHGLGEAEVDWKSAFQVRSAYRNESDFRLQQLRTPEPRDAGLHIARIIDVDASVSRNYERLAWKWMQDLDRDAPEDLTIGEYRRESLGDLQKAMRDLFSDPALTLQDFGGIQAGTFRFSKCGEADFHYKNLSGGEKAAFDVLLDVFVKRGEAREAIFCIDEPELHVATGLQGPLIAAILELLGESSQLWIATHSIGIVREAYRMLLDRPGEVVFLDFSNRDSAGQVTIAPSTPNRVFWENMYEVALDDLATLVAPHRVVICEGSKDKYVKAFDAQCYNRLFAGEFPETLFISQGGSGEVIQSEHLVAILESIARGIDVCKLIDRDDMTDGERARKIAQGISVLRRREPEEYLYDPEVLRTFLQAEGCGGPVVETVLDEREALVNGQAGPTNVKDVSRDLFQKIRSETGLFAPREQPRGVRLRVPGAGARQHARRVRGTPRGRFRRRLTPDAVDPRTRLTLRSSGGLHRRAGTVPWSLWDKAAIGCFLTLDPIPARARADAKQFGTLTNCWPAIRPPPSASTATSKGDRRYCLLCWTPIRASPPIRWTCYESRNTRESSSFSFACCSWGVGMTRHSRSRPVSSTRLPSSALISGKPTSTLSANGSPPRYIFSTAFTSCSTSARLSTTSVPEGARRLKEQGQDPVLSKSRWCFLKRKENLSDLQGLKLSELLEMNLRTVRAYLLKEDFQRFLELTPTPRGQRSSSSAGVSVR